MNLKTTPKPTRRRREGGNTVDAESLLNALVGLAESLGISVRAVDSCGGRGGALVRLKGKEVLFLETSADVGDRIDAAARALVGRKELQERFLLPEVRAAIDRAATNQDATRQERHRDTENI